jgi:hypothetical protein
MVGGTAEGGTREQWRSPSLSYTRRFAAAVRAKSSQRRTCTTGNDQSDELAPANAQIEAMAVGIADRMTLVRLWNRVLDLMQVQTSRHEFNTWVRRTALLSIANGVATVGTPNAFFKEGFEHRYIGAVRDLIGDLYVPIKQVRVVITGVGDQPANGLPSLV